MTREFRARRTKASATFQIFSQALPSLSLSLHSILRHTWPLLHVSFLDLPLYRSVIFIVNCSLRGRHQRRGIELIWNWSSNDNLFLSAYIPPFRDRQIRLSKKFLRAELSSRSPLFAIFPCRRIGRLIGGLPHRPYGSATTGSRKGRESFRWPIRSYIRIAWNAIPRLSCLDTFYTTINVLRN